MPVASANFASPLGLRGNTDCSNIAVLQRELRSLEANYRKATNKINKITEKYDECMKELRILRAARDAQQKEITSAHNMIQHLKTEKLQIEAQAISNREYAKKIEQKLAMGAKGQAIAEKNAELRSIIKSQEEVLHKRHTFILAQKAELQRLSAEVSVLNRALEIRVKELGMENGAHKNLLYELAQIKQENHVLALQTASNVDTIAQLKVQLKVGTEERDVYLARIGSLEQKIAELECLFADSKKLGRQLTKETEELTKEREVMLQYIQELSEKNVQLENNLMKKVEETSQAILMLKDELELTKENEKKYHEIADKAYAEREKLLEVQKITEETLSNERNKHEQIQSEFRDVEQKVHEMTELVTNLQAEVDNLTEINHDLQEGLHLAKNESSTLSTKLKEMEKKVEDATKLLLKRDEREKSLRETMESSLHDMELLTSQRDEATKAMQEAVSISAASLIEQQNLEEKLQEQRDEIAKIKQSKSLLQKAMLEQLAAVRQQLRIEREGRLAAEHKLNSSKLPDGTASPKESVKQKGDEVSSQTPRCLFIATDHTAVSREAKTSPKDTIFPEKIANLRSFPPNPLTHVSLGHLGPSDPCDENTSKKRAPTLMDLAAEDF